MGTPKKPVLFMLSATACILLVILVMQPLSILHFHEYIAVLFPKGIIALEQRNLLFVLQAIMLIVIIPVYVMTFVFSWIYREHSTTSVYDPDLVDSALAEYIWWGFPLILTIIISILTWQKTHELDPYKPIESSQKSMTVQVVALQWNWLFLYPEEKIASLNFLQIPVNTPVRFEITADAPMNSFWIPHLGGQIYAMPNMRTELNLIANEPGDFRGSSANLSGEGFSGMHFITRASSGEEYQKWVAESKKAAQELDWKAYSELAKPRQDTPPEVFQLKDEKLFDQIMMKYMHPQKKE